MFLNLNYNLCIILVIIGINKIQSQLTFVDNLKGLYELALCPPDQCSAATYPPPVNDPKVFGGTTAYAPYLVGLYIYIPGGYVYCGGSYINIASLSCGSDSKCIYIMSAAHCYDFENIAKIDVVFGSFDNTDPNEVSRITVTVTNPLDYKIHEAWDPSTFRNDISMLRICGKDDVAAIKKSTYINSIELPPKGYVITNQQSVLIGRGLDNFNGQNLPPKPSCVTIPCNPKALCEFIFQMQLSNQFCAGCRFKTACNGDSGSALKFQNMVIGIVSAGFKYCQVGVPTLFTEVSVFRDWLANFVCN